MAALENVPLPLIGLGYMVLLLAGIEIGLRSYRWTRSRRESDREHGGQEFLLSAVLGLLALLLGFTFSLSLSRYEARRDLVVQEANAIGTTWLRAELLQEPYRTEMTGLLRRYTDVRIAWSEGDGPIGPTAAAQAQMWAAMGRALRGEPSQLLSRGLMDSMNESIDAQGARLAARAAHVPDRVLRILVVYSVLAMVMLGYTMGGTGRSHRVATMLLSILLALALVVIIDLDRPRSGQIQVSQQPLLDVRASMGPAP
jgi:hypothetical protein